MFFIDKLFKKRKLTIIGRVENINIPSLDLYNIEAKIDTGAYRGAIHAENIEEIDKNGKKYLKFNLLDEDNEKYNHRKYEFTDYKVVRVRTTMTDFEERFAIPLKMEIAGREIKTQLSLSSRKDMRFPILIGRKALKKRFLVDASI
jgi:hypothetical protein